jgi:hypothetical protein
MINPTDLPHHVLPFTTDDQVPESHKTKLGQFIQLLGIPSGQISVKSRNTTNASTQNKTSPLDGKSRVIVAYPKGAGSTT